jgi:peptidoglycan pentaglycine glycine transferase (the first glycine)
VRVTDLARGLPQPYQLEPSTSADHPAWDAFLEDIGGSHTQSSAWAQVKASVGWQATRVVARADGDIVGGAQMLFRAFPGLGGLGYVANGPVLATADPGLSQRVLDGVRGLARRHRVQLVTLQPPRDGDEVAAALADRGCRPSTTQVTPRATVMLDLAGGTEALLAGMSSRTRYNVQLGARRGISVRDGTSRDLADFSRLLGATVERKRFIPLPETYFAAMWQVLHPRGQVRMTIAELDGEVLAGQLAVVFGDTVTNKMSVWSGRHGAHRPNEAVQWSCIRWAAANGYRWYDLEGIELGAARALLADQPLPETARQSVTSFKLGFGGRVVVLPPAHDDLYDPVLRALFTRVYPLLRDRRTVRRLVKRVRTMSSHPPATDAGA